MPRPRFAKLDPEKQAMMLDIATEEFTKHGLEGASYNKIIERCGLSKGVMYYYFDNKEDLFVTVLKRELSLPAPSDDAFAHIQQVDEFWEFIEELLLLVIQSLEQDAQKAQLLRHYTRALEKTSMREAYEEIENTLNAWMLLFFSCGQKVGAIRTDIPQPLLFAAALGLGQATDTWLFQSHETIESDTLREYSSQMIDMFKRLLHPRIEFL